MKAVQIIEPGRVEIVDIPKPEPETGEVLVQVMSVNTCPQWDLHLFRGEPMFQAPTRYPYTPGQPGHEMAGVVAAVGPGVVGLKVGDRVAAWRDPGHQRQGCYAEYVSFDPDHLLKLPEDADFDRYASLELGMCVGASFLDLLEATPLQGKRFGISGLGGAGLIAAQFAKAEGVAEVIGFEPNPDRRAFAERHDVDCTFDPTDFMSRGGKPPAVDLSLDCVGSKGSAEFLMAITGGIVAIFGVQREPFVYPCRNRKLKLFGYPGHSKRAGEYALRRIEEGRLDLTRLVGAHLSLEEYCQGVELLQRQGAVKICFHP